MENIDVILEKDDANNQLGMMEKFSSVDISSHNIPNFDGNNVSFVNITYTVQHKSFLAYFKKTPAKKILDNVR